MNLVNENGSPLEEPSKIEMDKNLTTAQVGEAFAQHLLDKAVKGVSNEIINKQLDVLYWAAHNILSHRLMNVALGFSEPNTVIEWSSQRADVQMSRTQQDFETTIVQWRNAFNNGEIKVNAAKPT